MLYQCWPDLRRFLGRTNSSDRQSRRADTRAMTCNAVHGRRVSPLEPVPTINFPKHAIHLVHSLEALQFMTPPEDIHQQEAPITPTSSGSERTPYTQGIGQIVITAILVVVSFAAGWFGSAYANRQNTATGDQRLVLQAWNSINQYYVVTSSIDQKKMAYAAISAIVGTLGDTGHSRFETPEEFQQEQQDLQNQATVGIGVYISGGGSQPLTIDSVIPGSPAAKSNPQLRPGDEIVGVNGKSIQ